MKHTLLSIPFGIMFGLAISSSQASAALLSSSTPGTVNPLKNDIFTDPGLSVRETIQNAALSIDAFGSNASNNGFLQTNIPINSIVLKAFLYSSSVWDFSSNSDVILRGDLLEVEEANLLSPNANPTSTLVWDVTSILKPAIEGTWGLQNHSIEETGFLDGEVLVVAYQNENTNGLTSYILDGELATTGDITRLDFATPYSSGDFFLSIASSFSFDDFQRTEVDVRTSSAPSRRLTSAAGGNDDGSTLR